MPESMIAPESASMPAAQADSMSAHFIAPVLTPEGRRMWEATLDALEGEDSDEQRETLTLLQKALDEDRPGQRRVFASSVDSSPDLR